MCALHLPKIGTRKREIHEPLVNGEQDLRYEEAAKAGWEDPYDDFIFSWHAYRWFLSHGYITDSGRRPDEVAGAPHTEDSERLIILDELEAVRTDPTASDHHMTRHAFRVALRTRETYGFPARTGVRGS